MGEFNLNLSTRPFPAYRVVNLGLIVFFFAVAGVTGWQLYSFQTYSGLAKDIREAEKLAREDKAVLTNTLSDLSSKLDRPVTTAKIAEIDFLNNLIIRKHFSWTQVFANLEDVIPDNVHLTSVSPEILKDRVSLHMEITCRSISDESEFIRRLQASPVFQDVVVAKEEQKGTGGASDVAVELTVSYFPEKAPPARAAK
jgi:hypothetical protein